MLPVFTGFAYSVSTTATFRRASNRRSWRSTSRCTSVVIVVRQVSNAASLSRSRK